MAKTIKAVFGAGQTSKTCPQWQYDYNTTLQFVGLDLPTTFEVDLANSKTGQSTTVLGDADGCCTIPAQYFIPGTSIFAWAYIVDSNSGYTRCQVEIPISPRAQHTGDPPTPEQQSALDQAIAMLNATTENIPNEINAALTEAKESGEFDGEDGEDGNGIWFIDAQYTRTISAGVQAQLNHMVGRPGATPAAGDLCVVSDGRFGSIASLTLRVAVVPVLCDLSGASAYEIAVEHGYTGTEAEWLETLKGADAVVDPTLTNAGEAADAKATGDELHRHYLELTALSPEIRADTYAWNLRKNYNGSGSYVTADGFGITSNYIPVQPGARVQNTAPERDGNGKYTAMHINEFAGTTWLRRTILASGKYLTIGADATSIRIAYGYASNQGVTITQELIDATFSVRIIQQPASGSGGGGITVDAELSTTSTNPVQNKVVKAALDGKGTYSKPAGGIPASDLAETYLTQHQDISGKLDKAQGVAHAGEFCVVGSDGNVTTMALSTWSAGSY